MRVRQMAWGWLFACVAFTAAACGDDDAAGTSTSTSGGGGGGAGGGAAATFGESPCGLCLATECTTFIDACRSEPTCAAYLDCVAVCPVGADGLVDPACEGGCPAPETAPASDLLADWSVCASATAGCVACGHAPSQPNPYLGQECSPNNSGDTCLECLLEKCCETYDQCFVTNPQCELLFGCIIDCPPTKPYDLCHIDCFAEHPEGVHDYLVDLSCGISLCSEPGACPTEWSSNACANCVSDKCGAIRAACLEDTECFLVTTCLEVCGPNPTCEAGCLAGVSAEDLALYDAWRLCALQECSGECE